MGHDGKRLRALFLLRPRIDAEEAAKLILKTRDGQHAIAAIDAGFSIEVHEACTGFFANDLERGKVPRFGFHGDPHFGSP